MNGSICLHSFHWIVVRHRKRDFILFYFAFVMYEGDSLGHMSILAQRDIRIDQKKEKKKKHASGLTL